ncbi:MAG: 4Fe-4S binding protein [Clostridiales bacterium]|nr:4Fe-4S binding protein [Clostridiales bacterium]
MLAKDGLPEEGDLRAVMPDEKKLAAGPAAIIECWQEIPCDACARACPNYAILPMPNLYERPQVDFSRCRGCGVCLSACPGLAIFIADGSRSEGAVLRLPYEFLPLPQAGQRVAGLGRAGEVLGKFLVLDVTGANMRENPAVIFLLVPPDMAMRVRNISLEGA